MTRRIADRQRNDILRARAWLVAAIGSTVVACAPASPTVLAPGHDGGPPSTLETVPAEVPVDGLLARQFWMELHPKQGKVELFPIYPGNRIIRDAGRAGAAHKYNFGGAATEASSCTPGVDCPADSVHMFTDQDLVTYVEDGWCYNNENVIDMAVDPTCGGAILDQNCAQEFTFCAPIRVLSNYGVALHDPVLDFAASKDSVIGCTTNPANDQGLCYFDSPEKIDLSTSAYSPSITGDLATTFPCAYCYGNLTEAQAAGRPGLGDVMVAGASDGLQTMYTDRVAMKLNSSVDFNITLTLYNSTPSVDPDPQTQVILYDGDYQEVTCHDPLSPGFALLQGHGFGPPGGCLTGGMPEVCDDSSFPTSGCCINGPPAADYKISFSPTASMPGADDWSDTAIFSQALPSDLYGCGVKIETPVGTAYTRNIDICSDRWRTFDPTPGLLSKAYASGGVLGGSDLVIAGGRTSSSASSMTTSVQAFPLPRCSSPSPNTATTLASLPSPRWGAASTVASNGLYVIGGAATGLSCASTVYRLGSTGATWATMAALPAAVCQATAVTLIDQNDGKEYIVVAGGLNRPNPRTSGIAPTLITSTYVYDVAAGTWATFTSGSSVLQAGRRRYNAGGASFTSSTASRNKGIIAGGATGPDGTVAAVALVDVVTISNGVPSFAAASDLPAVRSTPGVAQLGGNFYVAGGATTTATNAVGTSTLYAIGENNLGGAWTTLGNSGDTRHSGILAVTGFDEPIFSDIVRLLHVGGTNATLSITANEYNP